MLATFLLLSYRKYTTLFVGAPMAVASPFLEASFQGEPGRLWLQLRQATQSRRLWILSSLSMTCECVYQEAVEAKRVSPLRSGIEKRAGTPGKIGKKMR